MSEPYRVISIDAECNHLGGQAFCVALALFDADGERQNLVLRCPVVEPVNGWVRTNVLPAVADVPLTHDTYDDMVEDIRHAWQSWTLRPAVTIGHITWPTEANLLSNVFPGARAFDGPYPLIDVASMLHGRGLDPYSVDAYLRANDISLPTGIPHHPLYDVRAAERAYFHLRTVGRRR